MLQGMHVCIYMYLFIDIYASLIWEMMMRNLISLCRSIFLHKLIWTCQVGNPIFIYSEIFKSAQDGLLWSPYVYGHCSTINMLVSQPPFTLSHIQEICSRRLLTYFVKKWKISNWMDYRLLKFLLLSQCFQNVSAAHASESVYERERVKKHLVNTLESRL